MAAEDSLPTPKARRRAHRQGKVEGVTTEDGGGGFVCCTARGLHAGRGRQRLQGVLSFAPKSLRDSLWTARRICVASESRERALQPSDFEKSEICRLADSPPTDSLWLPCAPSGPALSLSEAFICSVTSARSSLPVPSCPTTVRLLRLLLLPRRTSPRRRPRMRHSSRTAASGVQR